MWEKVEIFLKDIFENPKKVPITRENEKFCEKKIFPNFFFIFLCGKMSENVRKLENWKVEKNCLRQTNTHHTSDII